MEISKWSLLYITILCITIFFMYLTIVSTYMVGYSKGQYDNNLFIKSSIVSDALFCRIHDQREISNNELNITITCSNRGRVEAELSPSSPKD